MKNIAEKLKEWAKREGIRVEISSIKKEDILPNYDSIVKIINAEKESEKRALDLKIEFKSRYALGFYS